jgi:hypothetical protein
LRGRGDGRVSLGNGKDLILEFGYRMAVNNLADMGEESWRIIGWVVRSFYVAKSLAVCI